MRLGAGHGSLLWYKTKHHLFTSGVSSLCRDSVCVQALFSCPYVMGRASEKNGETRIKDKRRVELKEEVNIVKTKEDSIYFVACCQEKDRHFLSVVICVDYIANHVFWPQYV